MFSLSVGKAIVPGNTKCQRSNTLAAQYLHALQELEGILHLKDVEIALLKSQVYSSQISTSIASSSGQHEAVHTQGSAKNLPAIIKGKHPMKGEESEMSRWMNDKALSTYSRTSTSDEIMKISTANSSMGKVHTRPQTGKQLLQACEVEHLHQRLQILERENEALKKEFLEAAEERKQLVKEIHQQFETVGDFLQLENQASQDEPIDVPATDNHQMVKIHHPG